MFHPRFTLKQRRQPHNQRSSLAELLAASRFPDRATLASGRSEAPAAVGSVPPGAPPVATWNAHVSVDSADETADKVRAAGGTVLFL